MALKFGLNNLHLTYIQLRFVVGRKLEALGHKGECRWVLAHEKVLGDDMAYKLTTKAAKCGTRALQSESYQANFKKDVI